MFRYISVVLLLSAWGWPSAADTASISIASEAITPAEQPAAFTTGLELHQTQYLDRGQTYFRDGAANSNTSFQFKTAADLHAGSIVQFKWNIDTEYSAVENWNYFRPHELYMALGDIKSGLFSFGRKQLTYSNWDDEWNTPLFQSRFMDDKLRTTQAGLIGFFFEREGELANLRAVFSPIYVPDMGPNFFVGDDIKLHSKNPWFTPPRSSFGYRGVPTNIDYSVDYPDVGSVIKRPGGAIVTEIKPSNSTFSRLSYGYLPMPGYLLKFDIDGHFQVPGNLDVQLVPRFLYHHVANWDLVYTRDENEFGLSVAADHPVKDDVPDGWEYQDISPIEVAEVYYKWTIDEKRSWDLKLSGLRVWGGDEADKGPAITQETLFERRINYTEAGAVKVSKVWRASGINADVKVLYDILESGMIFSGNFKARLAKSTGFYLSYDFFQILPGDIKMTDGFIDLYRGNDRVMTGVSHVF